MLKTCIIDQNMERTKLLNRAINQSFTISSTAQVTFDKQAIQALGCCPAGLSSNIADNDFGSVRGKALRNS